MSIINQDFSANVSPWAAQGTNTFVASGGFGVLTVTSVYTGARATLTGLTAGDTVNITMRSKGAASGVDAGIIVFTSDFATQLINWSDSSGAYVVYNGSFTVPSNGSVVVDLYHGSTSGSASFDYVTFDYAVSTVTGTAAQSFSNITTGTATGTVGSKGTAAQSFNSFTNTASGTQSSGGSAAQTFNSFSNSASGTVGAYAFIDTFTDTTGIQLQNHLPDFGVGWTRNGTINGNINADDTWSGNDVNTNCNYNTTEVIPRADATVIGTIRFQSFPATNIAGPGLILRRQDNSNQYQFWVSVPNGQIVVQRIKAGTSTLIATISWLPSLNTDYEFRFRAVGSQLQMMVNGVIVWPTSGTGFYTDADPVTAAGTAGIRGRTWSTMDNFRVQLDVPLVLGNTAQTFNSFTNTASGGGGASGTASQTVSTVSNSATGKVGVTDAGHYLLLDDEQGSLLLDTAAGTDFLLLDGVYQEVPAIVSTSAGGQTNDGTATQTVPTITQSAQAWHLFGSATQSFNSFTNSATGTRGTKGTGSSTVTVTQSAQGSQQFAASVAQTVPSVTQSANGVHSIAGSAAQTVVVTQNAVAWHLFGTAVESFSGFTQTASATHVRNVGTGTQSVPDFVNSATGVQSTVGSAGQTVPSVVSTASGVQAIGGTADQTVIVTQTAFSAFQVSGTATQVVPVTSDASGSQQYGSAEQVFSNVVQVAEGTRSIVGSAAQSVPRVVSAAVGSQMIGTAVQTVPALVQTAVGALTVVGTAAQSVLPLHSASGKVGFAGSSAASINPVTSTAQGYQQFGVQNSVLTSLVSQSASGTHGSSGTATQAVVVTESASATHIRHIGSADETIFITQAADGFQPPFAIAAQVVPPLVSSNSPYVLKDSFTDTDGVTLANHVPDIGGAWSADPTASIVIQGNKAVGSSGTSTSSYQNGLVMTNRDYDVVADITITSMPGSNLPGPGLFARYVDDSNQNQLYFNPVPGTITVQRTKAGSTSVYNNVGFTQVVGQTYNVRWIFRGGSTALFIDGVKVWPSGTGLFFDSNSLTDPGKAGIRSRNFGSLDNFQVQYAAEITAAGNAAHTISVVQSVSGSHARVGTAAHTITITQSATGQHRTNGTAVQTVTPVSQSATGIHFLGGSAAQVVPVVQTATGTVAVTDAGHNLLLDDGQGSVLLDTASGSDFIMLEGVYQEVPPIVSTSGGTQQTVIAPVAQIVPITQDAHGMLGSISYSNVTLNPVNQNAIGVQSTVGTAAQTITVVQAANGLKTTAGVAATILSGPFFTSDAEGLVAINANAVNVVTLVVSNGTGTQGTTGTAVQAVSVVSSGTVRYGVYPSNSVFNDFVSDARGGVNLVQQRGGAKRFGTGFRF